MALSSSSAAPLHEEEEDDGDWIPMTTTTSETALVPTTATEPHNAQSQRQRPSLQEMQRKLESRRHLKRGLVDHPIQHFYIRLIQNLFVVLWNQEIRLQAGLACAILGSLLQFASLMLMVFKLWRILIWPMTMAFIFIASFLYVTKFDFKSRFESTMKLLSNPEALWERLCHYLIGPEHLRWILITLLVFLPTLLEAKTFYILASMLSQCNIRYMLIATIASTAWMLYKYKRKLKMPKECINQGTIVLYGFCFFASFQKGGIRMFGGPFLVATGSILLHSQNGWTLRVLRQAVRLSLRDVLVHLSEAVTQDEMLQLAMLRWIVDYWSYKPNDERTTEPSQQHTASQQQEPLLSHHVLVPASSSSNQAATTNLSSQTTTDDGAIVPSQELQWSDLAEMLQMTTHQMESEVVSPHQQHSSYASTTTSESQQYNTSTVSSSSSTTLSHHHNNHSLEGLTKMLASMDVDEHAKPAVQAYRRAVERFSPSANVSEMLAIVKRCPACLAVLVIVLFRPSTAILVLASFVAFELLRIQQWMETCRAKTWQPHVGNETAESASPLLSLPPEMDSMSILLSCDSLLEPCPLLDVWSNICLSVPALEGGLTAARAVQTTAVATEFAHNIHSLTEFGFEVYQHGWLHGLYVIMQEVFTPEQDANRRYSSAAMAAVENGSKLSRNVSILMQETDTEPNQVLGFLSMLVGRGWLWDRDAMERQEQDPSTREDKPSGSTNNVGDAAASVSSQVDDNTEEPSVQLVSPGSINNVVQESLQMVPMDETDERSLRPDKSKDSEQETENEKTSVAMEKLSDAYVQGLITEDKKNAFVDMLAKENSDEHVDAVIANLECLSKEQELLQEQHDSQHGSSNVEGSDATSEATGKPSGLTGPKEDDVKDSPLNTDVDDKDTVSSRNMISATENHNETGGRARVEPLSSAEPRSSPEQQEQQQPHWAAIAGVGLGVAGAIVAGLSITNSSKGGGSSEQQQERAEPRERPTPYIEEIVEDDETDEKDWETM